MSIKFMIMDSTGDTVRSFETFNAAKEAFNALVCSGEHMAYDQDTSTVITALGEENENVVFHRKIIGG